MVSIRSLTPAALYWHHLEGAPHPQVTSHHGCVSVAGGGGARIIKWVRQIDRGGWDCVIMADEQ
jgi:hypothetical protein